jgi:hypothetical protein
MTRTQDIAEIGKRSLTKHFFIMLASTALLHLVIVFRNNKLDLTSQIMLGAIALYYFWYNYSSREKLIRLRFGRLVAHVIGFLIINLSYHLHAFILFITNSESIKGNSEFGINSNWFGALFGMTTFWGIGLLIHLIASIMNRGFEETGNG